MGPIERELVQRYDYVHSGLVKPRPRGQILIRQAELDKLRWEIVNLTTKIDKLTIENKWLKENAKRFHVSYPATIVAIKKLSPLSTDKKYPTLERIIGFVADNEAVPVRELKSPRRQAHTCFARQIIFYLAKTLTMQSYPSIAHHVGGRDHSTVLHGYRKMLKLREIDPVLSDRLAWYQKQLMEEIRGPIERSDVDGTIRRGDLPAAEGPQAAVGAVSNNLFCDG